MKIPTTTPIRWFARLSLIAILLALGSTAHAANGWWGGGGADTKWGTVGNWRSDATGTAASSVPGAAETATFNTTALNTPVLASIGTSTLSLGGFAFNSTGTVGINAPSSVGSVNTTITLGSGGITMGSSAGNVTFGSGASPTFSFTLGVAQSWINNNTASTLNISGTTGSAIATGGFLLTVDGSGPTTIASAITGTGGLAKSGTGTLTLTGVSTYDGTGLTGLPTAKVPTLINNGTLAFGVNNALATAGSVTLMAGAGQTAKLSLGSFSATINTVTNGGVNGTSTSVNQIDTGSGTLTVNSLVSVATGNPTTSVSVSGKLLMGSSSFLTLNTGIGSGNPIDMDISAAISGASGKTFNKTGSGVVRLSGASDYLGITRISAGVLSINSIGNINPTGLVGGTTPNCLGEPASAQATISFGGFTASGTLAYTGPANTTDRPLNIIGNTGGATLDQSATSGLLKFSGGVTSVAVGTATGIGSHTVTLQGSQSGTGEIGGAIVDNTTTGSTVAIAASTTSTTLLLASVDGLVVGNVISSANIPANTTIVSINNPTSLTTRGVTLSAAASVLQGEVITSAGLVNITSLTKAGTGTWTLSGASTFTGPTTISGGKLALSGIGSIATTPKISIAASATFDVSAITPTSYAITGSSPVQTLAGSSTSGTATINATGKPLTLNSGALLSFQGTGTTVGKISVTGDLTLNANAITVNVSSTALAAGTYRLMDCTGTLTGSANATPTITGTALRANYTATVSTTTGSGGHVDLVVKALPVFSSIAASQSISYGTANVTLSGVVSATTGPVYPANGETVSVTINGVTQNATVSGGVGAFTISFPTATIPYSATAYTITYAYAGNATTLQPAANNTATTLTVTKATPTISGVTASQSINFGTASVTLSGTVSAAGPVYPANGETVGVMINGVTQNATIAGGAGAFSVSYTTATIPASATPYTITYSYAGNANLNAAADNTSTALSVYNLTTTPLSLTTSSNTAATVSYQKLATHLHSTLQSAVYPASPWTASVSGGSHGTPSIDGSGNLVYTPGSTFAGGADSFTVTFGDGYGSQPMAVSVTVTTSGGGGLSANAVTPGAHVGSNWVINFAGLPGTVYTVEYNTADSGTGWTKLPNTNVNDPAQANGNYTADPDNSIYGLGVGVFQMLDLFSNSGSRFYRTVTPAY